MLIRSIRVELSANLSTSNVGKSSFRPVSVHLILSKKASKAFSFQCNWPIDPKPESLACILLKK
jgi:hypothetical protein